MNACLVTPILFASRSITRSMSSGKSTFTRCTSRPGRLAFARRRWALRSSPASCISSRRAALSALFREVPRLFICACAADRDDADFLIAVCDKSRPRRFANAPNHLMARFVESSRRNLQPVGIRPNLLRFDKVDSVFCLVGCRFGWIELELQCRHRYRNYTIGLLRRRRGDRSPGLACQVLKPGARCPRLASLFWTLTWDD